MFEEPQFNTPLAEPGHRARRAGELTNVWRAVMIAAWVGIVLGFVAVWRSSWTLGLSTWWLGPEADPRFVLLLVLPFLMPLAMVAAALLRVRWVPYYGVAAAIGTALIAWGDVGRVDGLAVVELALAAGGLLVSVASLTGVLRPVERSVPSN